MPAAAITLFFIDADATILRLPMMPFRRHAADIAFDYAAAIAAASISRHAAADFFAIAAMLSAISPPFAEYRCHQFSP
jgi:hypothetical protein